MLILTAHKRLIGINAALDLIQIEPTQDAQPAVVDIQDDGEDTLTSGPMRGFRIIRTKNGVNFAKDGYFLCAEPHGPLVANRTEALEWETFTLVSREDVLNLFTRPAIEEVNRFGTKVADLLASGQAVKIYCGCGHFPRGGFLNLDIAVLAPRFAVDYPDEYFIFPYADMPWGIPDNCVDYIFHEDFIEHITQLQQIQFLAEAWRVLRTGCYHRVNTPNIITCMKRFSSFKDGYKGVYAGELQWGHISLFSPASLKEMAELVGYREVIFTTKSHGVSPFAEPDMRPGADRDQIVGNIFADLQK